LRPSQPASSYRKIAGNASARAETFGADLAPPSGYAAPMGNVVSGNSIAEIAAAIGDAARANILSALMSGRALTAGELTFAAGVTAQTTSGHLARLTEAGLLAVEKQGRHRYYRLTSREVAEALEALMAVAAVGPKRHHPTGPKDEAMRLARTCYDHLAGRLGVAIADALCESGHLRLADGAGLITGPGEQFLAGLGIVLDGGDKPKRPLCRSCIDWSERRPHLAGRLGAALLDRTLALGWIARSPGSRTVSITAAGERGFARSFDIRVERLKNPPAG
jgi:DNA-binding transcriptional ArsR family regulator